MVADIQAETPRGTIGKPDFCLKTAKSKISVIGQSKSTHNLLLPNNGKTLVMKYETSYRTVVTEKGVRTKEWSHIGHPLAQLLGYMVVNGRRYGALTSATRTYFVLISGMGDNAKANVSDPYFVGEVNYLRAWAFIHSLGSQQEDVFRPPAAESTERWIITTGDAPTPQPEKSPFTGNAATGSNKRKASKRAGGEHKKKSKSTKTSRSIRLPFVDFYDLEFCGEVGFGRNGSVFKVIWEGQAVALKQFDIGRDGKVPYEQEIEAYARTERAWGNLVPEPLFLSHAPTGGIQFLGLQLGRRLSGEAELQELSQKFESIQEKLAEEYGIRHNDVCCASNAVILGNTNGSEKLAVIDFEDWDDLYRGRK